MSVFSGGTYCVTVYRKGDEDGEDEYTDDPGMLLDKLRADADVRAVETHAVHYVTGNYESAYSFGNPDEEDED